MADELQIVLAERGLGVTQAELDAATAQATAEAEAARDKAQEWAENPEDTEVEAGQFSALHHAAKADASDQSANSHRADAETARDQTFAARDKAELWAEESEDVEVEAGQFSAKHWAAKSQDAVTSKVDRSGDTMTGPLAFPDGSAAAPAVSNSGDADTGIHFPAADTVAIATGGSEALRVDSGQRVGIEVTPQSWASGFKVLQVGNGSLSDLSGGVFLGANFYNDGGDKYLASDFAALQVMRDGAFGWFTAPSGTAGNAISFTQAMTLTNDGHFALGISSPTAIGNGIRTLHLDGAEGGGIRISDDGADQLILYSTAGESYVSSTASGNLRFDVNGAERARITAGGAFLGGQTAPSSIAGLFGHHGFSTSLSSTWATTFINSHGSSPSGIAVRYAGAAPNNTLQEFIWCEDNSALRFSVRSNGGVANYQANDANLSDERLKTDITPMDSVWDCWKALQFKHFRYADADPDSRLVNGWIAQEVEQVCPYWVDGSGTMGAPDDDPDSPYKLLFEHDMTVAMGKVVQELQSRVEALEANT